MQPGGREKPQTIDLFDLTSVTAVFLDENITSIYVKQIKKFLLRHKKMGEIKFHPLFRLNHWGVPMIIFSIIENTQYDRQEYVKIK